MNFLIREVFQNRVENNAPADTGNRFFKRRIKLRNNDAICGIERRPEIASHLSRARIAMRLKNDRHRPLQKVARGAQSTLHFGWMMRVIIVNRDLIGVADFLKTALDAVESFKMPASNIRTDFK